MSNVFISYRREDTAPYAGRLCDRLSTLFGRGSVFMDVQDIQPGQDFAQAIAGTIEKCHVLIAVIGPRWVESLKRRSQAGEDFVEDEIAEALAKNLTVIPVLVNNAKMPEPGEIPEKLQALSRYQAVEIRDSRFDDDFRQLANVLRTVPGLVMSGSSAAPAGPPRAAWRMWLPLMAAAAIAVVVFAMVRPHPLKLDGAWVAEMHKKGQPTYHIRLDLVMGEGTVNGTVDYPTGTGVIGHGTITGQNLTFQTVHTPQFASAPATVSYVGEATDVGINLTSVDDNGVATGVARRIP